MHFLKKVNYLPTVFNIIKFWKIEKNWRKKNILLFLFEENTIGTFVSWLFLLFSSWPFDKDANLDVKPEFVLTVCVAVSLLMLLVAIDLAKLLVLAAVDVATDNCSVLPFAIVVGICDKFPLKIEQFRVPKLNA